MQRTSHLSGQSAAYIEDLYETYLANPNDVTEEWRLYFDTLPRVNGDLGRDTPRSTVVQHFERLGRNRLKAQPEKVSTQVSSEHQSLQMRVQDLVSAYRHPWS